MTLSGIMAAIAVTLAYAVKGITGFANTLVFSSVMGFFANNLAITPIEVILGTGPNVFMAVRERRFFDWKVVVPLAGLMILGVIPGALFLKSGDPALIKTLFGFAITLTAVQTLIANRLKLKSSRAALVGIGILAGVMCGMYGIGALLGVYVSRTTDSPARFRANICFAFILVDIFRAILYTATGILTIQIVIAALKLAPFMVLGLLTGTVLAKKIRADVVMKLIMILLALSGVSLIVTNAMSMF